jgi:hypothetical protein
MTMLPSLIPATAYGREDTNPTSSAEATTFDPLIGGHIAAKLLACGIRPRAFLIANLDSIVSFW